MAIFADGSSVATVSSLSDFTAVTDLPLASIRSFRSLPAFIQGTMSTDYFREAAYPAYYDDYSYPRSPISYEAAYDSANAYNAANTELANAIARLSDEVEHLREERELRQALPPKPEPEKNSEPPESAVLVFRDKHVQEVKNYAIVGETFWILNEQQASIRGFPYRPPLKLAGLCQADHLSRNRRTCFGRPIAPGALHLKSICSVDFSIPSPLS